MPEGDSAWVKRENDNGEDRVLWTAKECPLMEECSAAAWKRAGCWSYTSQCRCRQKVRAHLLASGKHNVNGADAQRLADLVECEEARETYEDRETYRAQQEIEDEKKKEADEAKAATDTNNKKRINPETLRNLEGLEHKVARMEAAVESLKAPPRLAIGACPPLLIDNNPTVDRSTILTMMKHHPKASMNVKSKVKLALDSIDRSKHACLSMQRLATTSAQRCSELSQAFLLASAQYAEEAGCLADARQTFAAALEAKQS
jgi:hypothetical protein